MGPRVRNARRANTEQAETVVTPHLSAEIVALAGTNEVVIGAVKGRITRKKGWEAYQKLIFLVHNAHRIEMRGESMRKIRGKPDSSD